MSDFDDRPDIRVSQGRSPAYPYIPLSKALERADQIRSAGAARQAMAPEVFYNIWKIGPASSGARQTLAALNHFGLVEYIGRGTDKKVRLSDLAQRIVLDKQPSSPERDALIRAAALTPPIHREMYDRYGPILPADVVLQTFLARDMGYNEAAAEALIKQFKDTLVFSGLDKPANMSREAGGDQSEDTDAVRFFPDPAHQREVMNSMMDQQQYTRSAPVAPAPPAEEDVMRGRFQSGGAYKLYVTGGTFGVPEIDTIIRMLKAQREELQPPPTKPASASPPAVMPAIIPKSDDDSFDGS